MDGILALGHFCETHGPCVILCTQRCEETPKQGPHSLTVPWCEACQSIELHQAFLSRDGKGQYVTTRTPLQQDLAFLLKQATVRSLSCEEETNKDGGVLYFGDNERGHVFSYTFTLQDSLARGFHRRYCILLLMRDKIHLLNVWPFLSQHVKKITEDLQSQAASVNVLEQETQSQRSVRQAQGSPASPARSLSQLTGQPAVFAHLHLWFCWLFSAEVTAEKPAAGAVPFVPPHPTKFLRALYYDLGEETFRKVAFAAVTGHNVVCEDVEVLKAFRSLLPGNWEPLGSQTPPNSERCDSERGDSKRGNSERGNSERGNSERRDSDRHDSERRDFETHDSERRDFETHDSERRDSERHRSENQNVENSRFENLQKKNFETPSSSSKAADSGKWCKLYRDSNWKVEWNGEMPDKLPTLLVKCERFIVDNNLPDKALEFQLAATVLHWKNNFMALSWCPNVQLSLLKSLNVQVQDLPLMEFWMLRLVESVEKYKTIVDSLEKLLVK